MNENAKLFWKKKDIVSYALSVLVFLIHISSFDTYTKQQNLISEFNNWIDILFTKSIPNHAVTLFFIISGALFFRNYNNGMYLNKLKSRVKTLLIPYLIWNTIWMLFEIITSYSFLSSYFIGRDKFVLSLPNIINAIFHYECNGPFWFIFELMFFILISPVINWVVENKYRGLFVAAALLVLSEFGIGLPKPLFFSQTAIIPYIIGGIAGKHYFNAFSQKASRPVQYFSLVYFVCCQGLLFMDSYLKLNTPEFAKVIFAILNAFAFWNVFDLFVYKLKDRNFFKQSFAVYAIHINASAVITKLLYLAMPKNEYFATPNFIISFTVTLLSINLFCVILKRFLPKIYSVLMGTR